MTEEEFWAPFKSIVDPAPVFYRLYHDEQGYLLFYSMEDVPGNYIEIDHEAFSAGSPRVRVVDGQLRHIKTNVSAKLVPSSQGQACDPRDVAVINNDKHAQYWKLKATDETS